MFWQTADISYEVMVTYHIHCTWVVCSVIDWFSTCFWFQTDCPGTESEDAGKASACEGCPNQNICASSKPKGPDPGNFSVNDFLSLLMLVSVCKSDQCQLDFHFLITKMSKQLWQKHDTQFCFNPRQGCSCYTLKVISNYFPILVLLTESVLLHKATKVY